MRIQIQTDKPKLKKYIIIAYVLAVLVGWMYINAVLKDGTYLSEPPKEEIADKVETLSVTLKVELVNETQEFKETLTNNDTVNDLLSRLRDDNKLIYELTEYTHGNELNSVNRLAPPQGYTWELFDGETNITRTFSDVKLHKDAIYTLKLAIRNVATQ